MNATYATVAITLITGVTPFVYAGFFVQAGLGRALRSRRGGSIAAAVLGALAFFGISNFGVWLGSDLYPRTGAGLAACCVAALPFLQPTLLGDVLWTVALSAAYRPIANQLARRAGWVPVPVGELAPL